LGGREGGGGANGSQTKHASILSEREAYSGFYVGEVPLAPKILVVGQSSGSFKRRKKKQLWVHPTLINRNMNK
jgi:hypothetical protein